MTEECGVTFVKSEPTTSDSSKPPASESSFTMSEDLSSMTLTHYGKGYLLTPASGHSLSGTKYFDLPEGGQGWWRKDLGGWFFRSKYYDELVDMGAQFTKTSGDSYEVVSADEQFEYIPNFVKYGKGWSQRQMISLYMMILQKHFEGCLVDAFS